jgi:quercetin dioxygenase-like cupin family protein
VTDRPNLRHIDEVPFQRLWEGISGRTIESEQITLSLVELEPNGTVPSHQHQNEQVGIVIRGQVTFRAGDEERTLGPGGTWTVRSNVPHGADVGPEGATVVEVFTPIRDDWHALPLDEEQVAFWP